MLLPIVWAIAVTGCLVDDDTRCQAGGFEVTADGACACPAGSVVRKGRCQPCAEHEQARGTACECEVGYERDAAGRCALGDEQTDAGGSSPGNAGLGEACAASSECNGSTLCDVHASGRCVAAPSGLGMSCASQQDCAASEATYCEQFSSRTCQIQGCAEQAGRCPGDMACCDYQILSTSLCIPTERLEGGQCPAPGQLIERQEP